MARKVWDGRGDRMSDALMSFVPGCAADDLSLSGVHMRVLLHLGRQNSRRGWLRVSQKELSAQWKVSRQRINTAIAELVDKGYVVKLDQVQSGESFCLYKVVRDVGGDEGGVSPTVDTPSQGGVSPTGDTGVTPRDTRVSPIGDTPVYNARAYREAEKADRPLNPQSAERASGRLQDELSKQDRKLLADLVVAGVEVEVVTRLLEPVLTKRRFSDGDRAATLLALGQMAAGLEPEALDRALADVLEAEVSTIKAGRLKVAIETAIKAGARYVARKGTPQFDRWCEHLDRYDPQAASLARKLGVHQARTQWPVKPGIEPPPVEIALEAGDPRRDAWLAHYRANGRADEARLIERMRAAINVAEDWPPDSDAVLVTGGRATIPHGTPEHAAWLAVLRKDGLKGRADAQDLDFGRRPLGRPTRWPDLMARDGDGSAYRHPGVDTAGDASDVAAAAPVGGAVGDRGNQRAGGER